MVGGVQGLALTFQQPEDVSAQASCYYGNTGFCTWTHNATGGNSYIYTTNDYIGVYSVTPLPMTYSAATKTGIWMFAQLFDSAFNVLDSPQFNTGAGRWEMKMIGGTAHYYQNGVERGTSHSLAVNPSYMVWGGGSPGTVDDIIWGSTGSKYIFGMPETGYYLMKDIINPAASGFYRVNTTNSTGAPTSIASTSMTSTFGKGSGDNETVCLENYGAGCYQNYYTGTAYAGVITWNLTAFFESTAPYGLYDTTIRTQVPSTDPYVLSERIPYIGSGASIQFDKNSYAVGEEATLTVIISDGYYDTATYDYSVVIQDIWGTKVYDSPITFGITPYTGHAYHTWVDTNDEGLYYGLIYATRKSDNVDILMNYDSADLNSVLVVEGYVFNAEAATVLSGATVNVTQGTTTDSLTSAADGNYSSTSAFSANQPTTIVASKTGYETYQHVFTPLYAGSIQINLTLMPTTPTFSGVALGGIARTPPYNRTIGSATITITNANATYTVTTNSAGYYIKNYMRPNEWWNVIGSKTGFGNSSTYNKLVVGI